MRSKKTLLNTIMALVEEFVSIICAFILPRLILQVYGSKYNGLTTSISQFLACAVLLRAGIGGATRAALYKPIAERNKNKIDSIIKATDNFMKKIAIILLIGIILMGIVYPFLVKNEFSWFFTFSLFIIIGASTFAESFFGITYLIFLQANQKLWVTSVLKSICMILNVAIAVIFLLNGASIHIVKLVSATIYVIYPIVLSLYVKKKYNIDKNVKPDNRAISQRWDAFWHQVATFITNNTDVIVLTTFTNMLEVSVYSVYNMVTNSLKKIIFSFSNGLEAAFGNMIANNEKKTLAENLSLIEMIVYSISTIVYTCAILLIVQFVFVYTKGIQDVNYLRPAFAYFLVLANFFYSIRMPYQLVIQAAGHYKQTKNGAMTEALINIIISIILVIKLGIVGVAIGTFISMLFRTLQLSLYMSKNIINRSQFVTIFKIVISFIEGAIVIGVLNLIHLNMPENYFQWIINALIVGIISLMIVGLGNALIYHNDSRNLIRKMKNIFLKKTVK